MGSYADDAQFMNRNDIEYIELISDDGESKVMVVPAWQGRVMTTSAAGDAGDRYGWINYSFIKKKQINFQFNPVGGEERFWLGPEGGVFSLYFKQGEKQTYKNWRVPSVLDIEAFSVRSQSENHVCLTKEGCLTNTYGTTFFLNIERTISLLDINEIVASFNIEIPEDLKVVAYKSENRITNIGNESWSKKTGLISVWMLSMFNPTLTTTVFIPYKQSKKGKIVNDEYFGKIPTDRLIVENGVIYFKIDGCFRSKLGIPASCATNLCGSYDSSKEVLTVLWCDIFENSLNYMNGQWGRQKNPYCGDVINAYNDGPTEDGSMMGPFYEIETSSPGAELAPYESLIHTQKIIHLQGNDKQLDYIIKKLFKTDICAIKAKFQ